MDFVFSPDSQFIAAMNNYSTICVYDLDCGALAGKVAAPYGSAANTWSPDGRHGGSPCRPATPTRYAPSPQCSPVCPETASRSVTSWLDSGYAPRDAGAWALPVRKAGARLVQDLHPHDRGHRIRP
jgi:hypothetical protein